MGEIGPIGRADEVAHRRERRFDAVYLDLLTVLLVLEQLLGVLSDFLALLDVVLLGLLALVLLGLGLRILVLLGLVLLRLLVLGVFRVLGFVLLGLLALVILRILGLALLVLEILDVLGRDLVRQQLVDDLLLGKLVGDGRRGDRATDRMPDDRSSRSTT